MPPSQGARVGTELDAGDERKDARTAALRVEAEGGAAAADAVCQTRPKIIACIEPDPADDPVASIEILDSARANFRQRRLDFRADESNAACAAKDLDVMAYSTDRPRIDRPAVCIEDGGKQFQAGPDLPAPGAGTSTALQVPRRV